MLDFHTDVPALPDWHEPTLHTMHFCQHLLKVRVPIANIVEPQAKVAEDRPCLKDGSLLGSLPSRLLIANGPEAFWSGQKLSERGSVNPDWY
jgi:hypothetical protein